MGASDSQRAAVAGLHGRQELAGGDSCHEVDVHEDLARGLVLLAGDLLAQLGQGLGLVELWLGRPGRLGAGTLGFRHLGLGGVGLAPGGDGGGGCEEQGEAE